MSLETTVDGVKVLTVDDQEVFRRVARELVEATDGFAWAGEAASGREALERVAEEHPDLVLLDVRMPGMDGIETAQRLLAQDPDIVIVLVSLESIVDLPSATASVGVAAHLRKQELSPRTLQELWAAHGPGSVTG
jgi:CheY-like chemotaxis protein